MNARKCFVFLLTLLLMLPMFGITASAAETPVFRYELTVDGKDTVEVNTGDLITVTLHLYRTDAEEAYTMYAMQDEIRYDSEYFELVENSAMLSSGIQSTDIAMVDNYREFYMNYVSFSGGNPWESKTRVGSFQLKVTGEAGVTTITNEDFLVSKPDGNGSYKCDANVLTVILSTDCTVKFETNGGTPIDPITAIYGELLTRPEDPVREGKHLVGWFKDIHLTEEWDFDTDTVKGNMTLYAKWADGDPTEGDASGNPTTGDGLACILCGRDNLLIPGISLCWLCLLILILIALAVMLIVIIVLRKRKKPKHKGKFET